MTNPFIAELFDKAFTGEYVDKFRPGTKLCSNSDIERVFGPVITGLQLDNEKSLSLIAAQSVVIENHRAYRDTLCQTIANLEKLLAQREREITNLSRACADLQATKDDYYHNGVAHGYQEATAHFEMTNKLQKLAGQIPATDKEIADIQAGLDAAPQPPMAEQAEPVEYLRDGSEFVFARAEAVKKEPGE